MLKEIFYDNLNFLLNFTRGLYGKPLKRNWVVRVVFPIGNPSDFRQPLRSLTANNFFKK